MTTIYEPSPSDRVREQVERYEATDGQEGGTLEGRAVVILTTTGLRDRQHPQEPGDAHQGR
jgi:hypothetical protein